MSSFESSIAGWDGILPNKVRHLFVHLSNIDLEGLFDHTVQMLLLLEQIKNKLMLKSSNR